MEYVIPVVLVVLLVGGFVTFLVVNATKKGGPVADAGAPGIGPDETPLGDTTEYADQHEGQPPRRPARLEREQEPARPDSERLADREA